MCMFIVWYPLEFSRLHNLHPWYWNSLLHGLISCGENSAHFLQLISFTILHFSFHQVPITAGCAEAAWYDRFNYQTSLHMAGSLTRAPVSNPSTNRARCCLTSVIWRELVTTRPCATMSELGKFQAFAFQNFPHTQDWMLKLKRYTSK